MSCSTYVNVNLYIETKDSETIIRKLNEYFQKENLSSYIFAEKNLDRKHPEIIRITQSDPEINHFESIATNLREHIKNTYNIELAGYWLEENENIYHIRYEIHNGIISSEDLDFLQDYPNKIIAKIRKIAENLLKKKE